MADKRVNIDVVFRNGLKDYEVNPPSDIWDEIQPAVRSGIYFPVFVKIAASIGVIFVLAFFSYRLGINSAIRMADNRSFFPTETVNSPSQTLSSLASVENVVAEPVELFFGLSAQDNIITEPQSPEKNVIGIPRELVDLVVPLGSDLFEPQNLKIEPAKTLYYTIDEYNSTDFGTNSANQSKKMEQRWTIAALASPTYYTGAMNNSSQVILSTDEQPSISYAGGVAFSYRINERVSIQSGLYYSNIGQKINGISSYAGFEPINASKGETPFKVATTNGTIMSDNADIFLSDASGMRVSSDYSIDNFDPVKSDLPQIGSSLEQNFRYLEVPFSLRYKVVDGTLGINLFGGLSSNLLVGNNVYSNNDGVIHYIGKTDGLRGFVFSSTFGMGMEYNISNNVSLNFEPMLRYYITPINATSTGTNPFSFGLFSGIAYKF